MAHLPYVVRILHYKNHRVFMGLLTAIARNEDFQVTHEQVEFARELKGQIQRWMKS